MTPTPAASVGFVPSDLPAVDWLAHRSAGPTPSRAVLLHAPSHAFQAFGGGEAQLSQTGRHLDALGVPVRPFVPWLDRIENARLLHLFGLSREGLALAEVARARDVPIVVSPISWYEPKAILALASGPLSAGLELSRWLAQRVLPRWPRWKRQLLTLADAILPNSWTEGRQLVSLFGVDPARVIPVPNGLDPRFLGASPDLFRRRLGNAPFVLFVGRIEPRKNVMGLIRAVRSAGLPLTVIGEPPPGHESYAVACRREGPGVRWLGHVGHDDPFLSSAHAAARVLALPSWFETPGLAALEGGAAGAAVVVTPYGSAPEYFGDRARYARPDRPAEIVDALSTAWESGPDPSLPGYLAERYLWSLVAKRTAEVYDQVDR